MSSPTCDVGLRAAIVLNARAGSAARLGLSAEALRTQFAEAGLDVEVMSSSTAGLADCARRAVQAGMSTIVAAGGDGTIGTVAAALIGTDACLGILPVG